MQEISEVIEELNEYFPAINDCYCEAIGSLCHVYLRLDYLGSPKSFIDSVEAELRRQLKHIKDNSVWVEKETTPEPYKYKVLEWINE